MRKYWLNDILDWLTNCSEGEIKADVPADGYERSICLLISVLIHGEIPAGYSAKDIRLSNKKDRDKTIELCDDDEEDDAIYWERIKVRHQLLMEQRPTWRTTLWRRCLVNWIETYPDILSHAIGTGTTPATSILPEDRTLEFLLSLPLTRTSLTSLLKHAIEHRPDRLRKLFTSFGIDQVRKCLPDITCPILPAIQNAEPSTSTYVVKLLIERARYLTSQVCFSLKKEIGEKQRSTKVSSFVLNTNCNAVQQMWTTELTQLALLGSPLEIWDSIARGLVLFSDPYTWLLCLDSLKLCPLDATFIDTLRHSSLIALSQAFGQDVYGDMALEASICFGLSALFKDIGSAESAYDNQLVS